MLEVAFVLPSSIFQKCLEVFQCFFQVPHFIRKHNYQKYKQKLVDEGILLTEVDDADKMQNSSSSS